MTPADVPTTTVHGVTYRLPFATLFRALTAVEDAELRAALVALGILQQVVVYDSPAYGDNCVIDGANRLRLAAELDLGVPVHRFQVTDETARRMAEDLNVARRQVSPQEAAAARAARIAIVAAARAQGKSLRAIAAETGVSPEQVRQDVQVSGVKGLTPDRVRGADGKSYPANPRPAAACAGDPDPEPDPAPDTESDVEPDVEPIDDRPLEPLAAIEIEGSPEPDPAPGRRPTKRPAHQDDAHPYRDLLQAIITLATRISGAVNDAEADSKLRSYLLAVKFVHPRAKTVRGKHLGWQCVGLRGLYRVIDLAGRGGRAKGRAQLAREYAAAIDPETEEP